MHPTVGMIHRSFRTPGAPSLRGNPSKTGMSIPRRSGAEEDGVHVISHSSRRAERALWVCTHSPRLIGRAAKPMEWPYFTTFSSARISFTATLCPGGISSRSGCSGMHGRYDPLPPPSGRTATLSRSLRRMQRIFDSCVGLIRDSPLSVVCSKWMRSVLRNGYPFDKTSRGMDSKYPMPEKSQESMPDVARSVLLPSGRIYCNI